ncbi:uncharacterized protein LOC144879702 [Branchiostoma floridae x Branchiostoma japonicum]
MLLYSLQLIPPCRPSYGGPSFQTGQVFPLSELDRFSGNPSGRPNLIRTIFTILGSHMTRSAKKVTNDKLPGDITLETTSLHASRSPGPLDIYPPDEAMLLGGKKTFASTPNTQGADKAVEECIAPGEGFPWPEESLANPGSTGDQELQCIAPPPTIHDLLVAAKRRLHMVTCSYCSKMAAKRWANKSTSAGTGEDTPNTEGPYKPVEVHIVYDDPVGTRRRWMEHMEALHLQKCRYCRERAANKPTGTGEGETNNHAETTTGSDKPQTDDSS